MADPENILHIISVTSCVMANFVFKFVTFYRRDAMLARVIAIAT